MVDVIKDIEKNMKKTADAAEKVVDEAVEEVEEVIEGKKSKKKKPKKKKPKKKSSKKKEKAKDSKSEEKGKDSKKDKTEESGKDDKKLKKDAEEESTTKEKSLEERKKELLERAKKLGKEKIDITSTEELKKEVKPKKRKDMLIPLEEYVKAGIYLGTRVVTPDMKPFVYRRRADGLAIFNTDIIDEKLKESIKYLSKFDAKDVILVCKRQSGWKTAEMFGRLTGIRVFTKKYPAGILTNTDLPDFFENELTIITDHWLDKNALNDTLNVRKKVLMICDTNNFSKGADKIIIGNNKSARSVGLIFYLLAKGYCKAKGLTESLEKMPGLDWWTKESEEEGARFGV